VLTHAHFDHMGFARRAKQQLGVPLWAHEREVPLTRHPWRYDHERPRSEYLMKYPGFRRIFAAMGAAGALWVRGVDDVQTFGDDAELDVPGRPRVIFSPGHTYGHCALHLADRGTLLAGDAIVTLDPYTAHVGPHIVARAATADSEQARASLDRLVATGAQTVLPGHGNPWTQGIGSAAERARAGTPH
jgi:glyoxylase-like metal-dependent hydrolase (beta-lactamase superfamily II)